MILECYKKNDIYGRGPVIDYQYFGKDAENFMKSIEWNNSIQYLGKECITNEKEFGIIIGIEDCNSMFDYYFIVYVPEINKIKFELANNPEFTKNIKV